MRAEHVCWECYERERMKTLARERDKAEVLRRLKALGPNSVRRWGRMSAHQMVCHLSDSCRMLTCPRPVGGVAGFLPRPIMKVVALYLPMRLPPGIRTTPELDQEVGGTAPGD